MKNLIRRKHKQFGQGMTEYIIIVALIAVAAIGVYSFFGQAIRGQVAGLASEVAGGSSQEGLAVASGAAASAVGEAKTDKKMGSYGH